MKHFGPTRGELKFRLAFSFVGLVALLGALVYRDFQAGPAMVEVLIIAGGFFGGSAIWTILKLVKHDHPQDS